MYRFSFAFRTWQFNTCLLLRLVHSSCFRYSIKLRGHGTTGRNRNPSLALAKSYLEGKLTAFNCSLGSLGLRCRSLMSERQRPSRYERIKAREKIMGSRHSHEEGLLRSPREREFSKYLRWGRVRLADRSGNRWPNYFTVKHLEI